MYTYGIICIHKFRFNYINHIIKQNIENLKIKTTPSAYYRYSEDL